VNAEDFRALLEQDLSWRMDELRHLRNALSAVGASDSSAQYRRTVVVMTYAHFEGFAKQALGAYANYVNRIAPNCVEVTEPLAATVMDRAFKDFRQPQVVPGSDTSVAVEGRRLRAARRDTEFIRSVRELDNRRVVIEVDDVIATESNLNYDVLQRVLYRLGLDPDEFSSAASSVGFLVRVRNRIAHGERSDVVPDAEFRSAMAKAVWIMEELVRLLYAAVTKQKYRR
jgi:hypothetical protein